MYLVIVPLFIWVQTFAQVDYNKVILPDNARTEDFGEKLVQLAWKNHPLNEVTRREVDVAGLEVKKTSGQWLDIFSVQGNLNEFNINPSSDLYGRSAFFPKYNFRAAISLGMLMSLPATQRQNKTRLQIAQANVNAKKLELRNVVMKAYNEFLTQERMFKIHSQLVLDNETSFRLVEQRFKNGEITFEEYANSSRVFSEMTLAQVESEKNYKNAKLDLEQLIGVRLEEVR